MFLCRCHFAKPILLATAAAHWYREVLQNRPLPVLHFISCHFRIRLYDATHLLNDQQLCLVLATSCSLVSRYVVSYEPRAAQPFRSLPSVILKLPIFRGTRRVVTVFARTLIHLDPILGQMGPVHSFTTYFFKTGQFFCHYSRVS